jgi:hypothetical protein
MKVPDALLHRWNGGRHDGVVFDSDVTIRNYPDGQIGLECTVAPRFAIAAPTCSADIEILAQAALLSPQMNVLLAYPYGSRSDKNHDVTNDSVMLSRTSLLLPLVLSRLGGSVVAVQSHDQSVYGNTYNLKQFERYEPRHRFQLPDDCAIVYPDESAAGRGMESFVDFVERYEHEVPTVTMSKRRTSSGIELKPLSEIPKAKSYVVLDDLCDGGATFGKVALALPEMSGLHLVVAHGVFSRPLSDCLSRYKSVTVWNTLPFLHERHHVQDAINSGVLTILPL